MSLFMQGGLDWEMYHLKDGSVRTYGSRLDCEGCAHRVRDICSRLDLPLEDARWHEKCGGLLFEGRPNDTTSAASQP